MNHIKCTFSKETPLDQVYSSISSRFFFFAPRPHQNAWDKMAQMNSVNAKSDSTLFCATFVNSGVI